MKTVLNNFNQIKIILTEDLVTDPSNTLKEICKFLEVDENYLFDTTENYNVSKFIPKNSRLHRLLNIKTTAAHRKKIEKVLPEQIIKELKFLYKSINQKALSLNKETEEYLKDLFKDDIQKLGDLIQRDLSHWYL